VEEDKVKIKVVMAAVEAAVEAALQELVVVDQDKITPMVVVVEAVD
jgi:hypothetical protein